MLKWDGVGPVNAKGNDVGELVRYIRHMKLNQNSIFLIDGVGALMSAAFTGLVLPLFSSWIGLPAFVFYFLALFPSIYAVYSLVCYGLVKNVKPWMLKLIIGANIFYCFVSGSIFFRFEGLTTWGRLLLGTEILILAGIIALEYKVYVHWRRTESQHRILQETSHDKY